MWDTQDEHIKCKHNPFHPNEGLDSTTHEQQNRIVLLTSFITIKMNNNINIFNKIMKIMILISIHYASSLKVKCSPVLLKTHEGDKKNQ